MNLVAMIIGYYTISAYVLGTLGMVYYWLMLERELRKRTGDVRKARGVWQLMTSPIPEEVQRVAQLMIKYSPDNHNRRKTLKTDRLPGM